MKRYILKRVLQLVPILFGITLLSFILMNVGTADVIDVMESSTGSALTEEEFEDFTSLFSHYGNGETVVKIKRGSKLYKMRNINDCRGLRDELYIYLSDKDIVRV